MTEPAFDWETCKHTPISPSMAVSIVERVAGEDNLVVEEVKDEIHKHASGMMMARGKSRAPRSYR